jgi:hypothetical protein
MGYICAPQDYKIWLGHAKIDRVKNKKEKAEIFLNFADHRRPFLTKIFPLFVRGT